MTISESAYKTFIRLARKHCLSIDYVSVLFTVSAENEMIFSGTSSRVLAFMLGYDAAWTAHSEED